MESGVKKNSLKEVLPPEIAMKMATEIVIAYLGKGTVNADRLAQLVREIRDALLGGANIGAEDVRLGWASLDSVDTTDSSARAANIEKSITPDYLISFEDGRPYRSLKRHLMAKHGLTPDAYRQKWGLSPHYPMVAPNYAKARSDVAKRTGLGHRKVANAKKAARSGKRKSAPVL